MSLTLKRWLQLAKTAQAEQLAKLAQTSVAHLRHIAKGRRHGSAKAAILITEASVQIDQSPGEVSQHSVCPACKTCQFYRRA